MRRHRSMLIVVCYAVAVATSCSLATGPANSSSYGTGSRRILFIGNSLTAANQMPALLVALAESAKVSPLPTADVDWHPDFALIDHWSIGEPQPLDRGQPVIAGEQGEHLGLAFAVGEQLVHEQLRALRGVREVCLALATREAVERETAPPRQREDEACAAETRREQEAALQRG